MRPTAGCTNPKCTCDPCTCSDCKCGVTTLGDLERRVMEILWEHPGIELSGRQIADRLPGYAYTTVATVLGRLGDKGQVRHHKVGRTTRFASVDSESAHAVTVMQEVLATTDDPVATLVALARSFTPEDAAQLRAALAVDGAPTAGGGSCH